MSRGGFVITGYDSLMKELKSLPDRAAKRLQSAVAANHYDHRNEVIRSSSFKSFTPGNLRQLVRVKPDRREGVAAPTRIQDVVGETYSVWTGSTAQQPGSPGAAARIEKSVGQQIVKPVSKRMLLIPTGDFLTKQGLAATFKLKSSIPGGGKKQRFDFTKMPDTFWHRTASGKLLLLQTLDAGKRGVREGAHGGLKGVRTKSLGRRTRIVATAHRVVRQTHPLDFFGSWDRLEGKRNERFNRLLDDVVMGK